MYIRQVKSTELDELLRLINDHVLNPERLEDKEYISQMQAQGFLIGKINKASIIRMMDNVFLVALDKKKVIGYLRIEEQLDDDFVDLDKQGLIDWVHTDFKHFYYQLPHFEIGGILVSGEYGRRKIAESLLNKAIQKLRYRNMRYMFSFVPTSPIRNEPSLKFHLKNGFKIIARLQPIELWGMNHYQSVLLMKRADLT